MSKFGKNLPKETQLMISILRVDASSRPAADPSSGIEGSYSRELADDVLSHIKRQQPDTHLKVRDLAAEPLPHISNQTIQGYYTAPESMSDDLREATALSDALVGELKYADILLLSVPAYNFSIPSALKAWIDQVVRIGYTFAYEDGAFSGLVSGKRAYVCYAYGAGGYLNDGPLAVFDHMAPYVTMILNFIGITDVTSFAMEATTADADTINAQRNAAKLAIATHFSTTAAA